MSRYPVYPPSWPPGDPDTEAAIGRFVIAWGLLELQIDEAIGDIFDVEHTMQSSIVANLGTKSKIEIFLSAFHIESEFFPAPMLAEVNKLGHDTATAAGVYRVWVAHGQPFRMEPNSKDEDPVSEGAETFEPFWIWAKTHARKGGVMSSMARLTPEIFNNHTEAIKRLVDRWHSIRQRMARPLTVLRYVKRDAEPE